MTTTTNGTSGTSGKIRGEPSLATLREERKLVRARLGLARDRALLESFGLWDSYGLGGSDLYDRVRPRSNDGDQDGRFFGPLSVPTDRRHGSDWPVFRTQQELDAYRQESRIRAATNSFARGLLKNLVNNVIGKGYAYKVQVLGDDGKPAAEDRLTDAGKALCHAVQQVVDGFLRDNHWNGGVDPRSQAALGGTLEREVFRTVQIDGECFLRFHRQAGGRVQVRVIDSAQVRDGGNHLPQEGWTYGIKHSMEPYEDVTSIRAYAVFWPDVSAKGGVDGEARDMGSYEVVPADEVLHLKGPDTPSTVKRGLGLFLFDVGAALDRASKLQRNASIGAAVRSAIAETWQYETATAGQLQSMADALAAAHATDPTTGQTTPIERVFPGMIRRGPKGAALVQPSADNTEAFLHGVQGDIQQACAGAGVPSFAIGDVSSGNYSNYESASFPPVQNAICEQEYYKVVFCRAVWKALEWAVQSRLLPDAVLAQILITVDAPAVLHRNEMEKAQEDQILIGAGIKDRQTAAAERGLEWRTVMANNEEYQKEQQAFLQPPLGAEGPGGMSGGPLATGPIVAHRGGKGFTRQRAEGGPPVPAPALAGESLHEALDTSGHEHRGKGPGGGQFVTKGKGGAPAGPAPAIKHLTPDEVKAARVAGHIKGSLDVITPGRAKEIRQALAGGHGARISPRPAPASAGHHDVAMAAVRHHGQGRGGVADIADVRDALAGAGLTDRGAQDQVINDLRRAGKLSGLNYDGRHGLSDRQQAALLRSPTGHTGEDVGLLALREGCEPNRAGRGHHDTETGHPCRPGGGEGPEPSWYRRPEEIPPGPSPRAAPPVGRRPPPRAGKASRVAGRYRNEARRRRVLAGLKREEELAGAIGGINLPDSEPADVVYAEDARGQRVTSPLGLREVMRQRARAVQVYNDPQADAKRLEVAGRILSLRFDFFEVKTLLVAEASAVHMSAVAQKRKRRWQEKYGALFHLVAVDDRRGRKHSGHRVHVSSGTIAGTVRLARMDRVGSMADVLGAVA
jgi:hypothetical protein